MARWRYILHGHLDNCFTFCININKLFKKLITFIAMNNYLFLNYLFLILFFDYFIL